MALDLLAQPVEWAPDNTVAIVVAATAAVGSVIGGVVAARASVRANKITAEAQERAAERTADEQRAKAESEAFERARAIYDHAIDELREELARVRAQHEKTQQQLDEVYARLLAERTASQQVRDQLQHAQQEMAQMRERITLMERTIDRLRQQIITAGLVPEVDGHLNGGG